MAETERKPFDPESIFDQEADAARRRVVEFCANDLMQVRTGEQIEARICGYLTGLVGGLLVVAKPEDRKQIEEYLVAYMPLAVEQAYSIMEDGGVNDQPAR